MNHERILSHKMSQKLSIKDLEEISAAGTTMLTEYPTLSPHGSMDMANDIAYDI